MNLKELKKMIAEEYSAYTEQAAPALDVDAGDVDAGGDEDSEDTLRQIYDMLKDYFEGDDDATPAGSPKPPTGAAAKDDDADDADDDKDDAEALQERFKKLANIIKG